MICVLGCRSQSGAGAAAAATAVAALEAKLLKADLHGAVVTVVRSKCPSLIGASGLLVMETQETFRVVTEQNKLKGALYVPACILQWRPLGHATLLLMLSLSFVQCCPSPTACSASRWPATP
jgi:hypothetical protein